MGSFVECGTSPRRSKSRCCYSARWACGGACTFVTHRVGYCDASHFCMHGASRRAQLCRHSRAHHRGPACIHPAGHAPPSHIDLSSRHNFLTSNCFQQWWSSATRLDIANKPNFAARVVNLLVDIFPCSGHYVLDKLNI